METNDMPDGASDSWHRKLINLGRTFRHHPAWSASLIGFLVVGAIGVFLEIAEDVRDAESITLLDQQLADWLHVNATPTTTQFMLAVSAIHDLLPMTIVTALLALMLHKQGKRDWLLGLLLVVPGGIVINTVSKHLMARPRPHFIDPIVTLTSFSFPSGHTSVATLLYGFLAALLISATPSRARQGTAITGALSLIILVAASRMYLGAHFLSDVLAAFFESVAWLGLCLVGLKVLRYQRARRRPRT